MKRIWSTAVACALAASLFVPATASASPSVAPRHRDKPAAAATAGISALVVSDDNIPGTGLPASPVAGYMNPGNYSDMDDVYSVYLNAGQSIYLEVTIDAALDADVFVFSPAATDVWEDIPVAGSASNGTEYVYYTAPTAGTYYIDISGFDGAGNYSIAWSNPTIVQTLTVHAAPITVNYNGSVSVTGTLFAEGAPVTGAYVDLWRKVYGSDWRYYGSSKVDTDGAYGGPVTGFTRMSYVQVENIGDFTHVGLNKTITVYVKPFLPTPVTPATSPTHNKAFATYGFVRPRDVTGSHTVKLLFYHRERQSNGTYKYVYRKSAATTNYFVDASTSKYLASVSLPYAGYWQVKSFRAAGAGLLAQTSPIRTFYVR